jgi:hypothetical protein
MLAFADEVGDDPMVFPNLKILCSQTDKFGAPETAPDQ